MQLNGGRNLVLDCDFSQSGNFAADELRLRPDAQACADMPGFVPIPLEMSGLHHDESLAGARSNARSNAPVFP
jgi:hypothetical protein